MFSILAFELNFSQRSKDHYEHQRNHLYLTAKVIPTLFLIVDYILTQQVIMAKHNR